MYARSFFFVFILFVFVAQPTAAATLYIDPPQKTLGRGDAEIFKVRLDTDEESEECVNAVSGVIAFSGPIEPIDVSTGNSILSIWLEPPKIHSSKREVTFAGGIPNGYCGRIDGDPNLTNVLFEVIARAETNDGEVSPATLSFTSETTAYLNDGLGTPAGLNLLPSTITIGATTNAVIQDPWTEQVGSDKIRPQEFSILLTQGQHAFPGKYFISFSTTDKQSGIDHYEVMEEPLSQMGSFLWGRADAPWVKATSPHTLDDQSLNSIIRVRAIDKAGNEYVANLIPDAELRSMPLSEVLTYILFVTIFVGLALFSFFMVRRKRKQKIQSEIDQLETYRTSDNDSSDETNSYDHDSQQ